MQSSKQHVTSIRLPESVYEIVLAKAIEMDASLSAMLREVIIDKFMPGVESEHDKIRCYSASRTKLAAELQAKKKEFDQ